MKLDAVAYEITVHLGKDHAMLLCVAYFLDSSKQHRGFEFYQRFTTFPRRSLPDGRQANFAEELLATDFAAHPLNKSAVSDDETVIRERMAAVYGQAANITVNSVPLRDAANA